MTGCELEGTVQASLGGSTGDAGTSFCLPVQQNTGLSLLHPPNTVQSISVTRKLISFHFGNFLLLYNSSLCNDPRSFSLISLAETHYLEAGFPELVLFIVVLNFLLSFSPIFLSFCSTFEISSILSSNSSTDLSISAILFQDWFFSPLNVLFA